MKRIILLCFLVLLLSGCTVEMRNIGERELDFIQRVDVNNHILCIDGIEYIMYTCGYKGYMAPHLKADKFDNPKVIRCKR